MKINVLYTAFALILAAIFISCDKEEIIFEGPYHVRFTDSLITLRESESTPLKISVHNAGPQLNELITVKYAIEGTAREGKDYEIDGTKGEVKIPAGESFGFINLQLINNANNILESQELVFTIYDVSPSTLQIGRSANGIIGKTFKLIIEDDCILSGSYKSDPGEPGFSPIEGMKVTSVDCKEYTLSNWDVYLTGFFPPERDLTFTDNGDNTLTILEQPEEIYGETVTLSGNGSVDPETGRLTFNITQTSSEGSETNQIILVRE